MRQLKNNINTMNWKKIFADVLKAAIGALLTGLGFTLAGCQIIPIF